MDWQKLLAWALGVVLLGLYFRSISVAALLAQQRNDAVLRAISWAVRVALTPRRGASYEVIQSRMDWFMPLQVLLTVVTWFAWLTLAFSCFYWASGSVDTLAEALVASGSALSTLGFFTPDAAAGRWLAIAEGMLGLVAVVYLFTFVPGFLSTLQQRSEYVGWIAARAGQPLSAATLLRWMHLPGAAAGVPALWSSSEQWFRLLAMTHSTAPELMYMPSFLRGHWWTATAGTLLEAAAFSSAALQEQHSSDARIALQVGSKALTTLADALKARLAAPGSVPPARPTLDAQFDALWDQLAASGAPLTADREPARHRWHALRSKWAPALAAIAAAVGAPSGLGLEPPERPLRG